MKSYSGCFLVNRFAANTYCKGIENNLNLFYDSQTGLESFIRLLPQAACPDQMMAVMVHEAESGSLIDTHQPRSPSDTRLWGTICDFQYA